MHSAAVFQFLQDIKRSFFMYVGNVDCIKFCVFVCEAGLLLWRPYLSLGCTPGFSGSPV